MNCLHSAKNGLCPHAPVEGSLFCSKHSNQGDRIAAYIVDDQQLSSEYDRYSRSNLLTLREEVVLIRSMINDRLNFARNEAEKIVAYNQISSWVVTLDKLVNSLHKLERETSEVLTRETLMNIARQMIAAISEEIKLLPGYEPVIDKISRRIVGIVSGASNLEHRK